MAPPDLVSLQTVDIHMYAIRQAPHGEGTKFYLESFLREDFIRFGIVLRCDRQGRITGLSFNSHSLGTVDIEADRTVQCFRWEDADEAERSSPIGKHYPTITGVRERDRNFAATVVEEVLESIGNDYLRGLLEEFFIVRKSARIDPRELPGGGALPKFEYADEVQAKRPPAADVPKPAPARPEAARKPTPPTYQPLPYQPPSDSAPIAPPVYRPRQPEDISPQVRQGRTIAFQHLRLKFDLLVGLGLLGLVLGVLVSAQELRKLWLDIDPDLYCNRGMESCFRIERTSSRKDPRVIGGVLRDHRFEEWAPYDTIQPAFGFLISQNPLDGERFCWVVESDRLLFARCRFNDKNYDTDYLSVFEKDGELRCFSDDGTGPRRTACFPERTPAWPWFLFGHISGVH